VAVRDLAEEKGEMASLANPVVMQLPAFPPELLHVWVGGEASIRFKVHEDGSVSDAAVIAASHAEFGEAARLAANGWKFNLGVHRITRKPVGIWARCVIVFKVDSK
jgi:TonB family protein